jgi:5-methylcytosine-specific restriction protein A
MREELLEIVANYPKDPPWRDPAFKGSPVKEVLEIQLPQIIKTSLSSAAERFIVQGSAGQGGWTHTPWLVLLDKAVTTSVEEGFYVVYLFSKGLDRLYLSLNQGCTALKDAVGLPAARETLSQRAEKMWQRAKPSAKMLKPISIDLNVAPSVWRGKLYERGLVAGIEYATNSLPSEATLREHLFEALDLYNKVKLSGGWEAEDTLLQQLSDEQIDGELEQAKLYRQHRSIERQTSHSKKVKQLLGFRCMACDSDLREIYGDKADGIIEAHHLIPLSSLKDGQVVRFNPRTDFAVLCPNCHRVIHRLADPSDLEALRSLLREGSLRSVKARSC